MIQEKLLTYVVNNFKKLIFECVINKNQNHWLEILFQRIFPIIWKIISNVKIFDKGLKFDIFFLQFFKYRQLNWIFLEKVYYILKTPTWEKDSFIREIL